MEGLFQGAGAMGSGLIIAAVGFATLIGSCWIGTKAYERSGRRWVGWSAGIGCFAGLWIMISPAVEALREDGCKGAADFYACMNPEPMD